MAALALLGVLGVLGVLAAFGVLAALAPPKNKHQPPWLAQKLLAIPKTL